MYKESKAESKKQQRFFGMVHSVQKGELSPSKVGPAVRKAARNTEYSDAKDFASTKHKNLPEKKGSLQMKYFEKNAKTVYNITPGQVMSGTKDLVKVPTKALTKPKKGKAGLLLGAAGLAGLGLGLMED